MIFPYETHSELASLRGPTDEHENQVTYCCSTSKEKKEETNPNFCSPRSLKLGTEIQCSGLGWR